MKKGSMLLLEVPEESKINYKLNNFTVSARHSISRQINTEVGSGFKTQRNSKPKRRTQIITSLTPDLNQMHSLPPIISCSKINYLVKPSHKDISDLVSLTLSLPTAINYLGKVLNLPLLYPNRKTLILDMDETLTHTPKTEENSQISLKISNDSWLFLKTRPYLQEFLQFVSEEFEVVIFTASQKKYADIILNYLDPENKLIHYRLYREHCYCYKGQYIKDIRILGIRELKNIIIVDNLPTSFVLQIENGIKISSWSGDTKDTQLKQLIDYLKILKISRDVRTINRNTFGIHNMINEELMKRRPKLPN